MDTETSPQPTTHVDGKIIQKLIENEVKKAYLAYSMSVIVGRALPDVRDGLKPVHRRILYSMFQEGLLPSKRYSKCAGIIGDVLKKFHPHGDTAVYDALVRMAQEWNLRYLLVEGQGNFGCFTANTKVKLTDGRNLTFLELVKEWTAGKKNYTYTVDANGEIKIAEIKHPRKTKLNAKLVKVVLDNGEEIKCTPNHLFMLKNQNYKEAQYLKPGDSLMPLYTRFSTIEDDPQIIGYEMTYQPTHNIWLFTHHLTDKFNIENKVYTVKAGKVRHHKDFNKLNNNPDNILRMQWKDHWILHAQLTSQKHKNDVEYQRKLVEGRRKFWLKEENKVKYSKRISQKNIENWKDKNYRKKTMQFLSEVNKTHCSEHPELKEEKSRRLKKLWTKPEYREKMSILKSREMKQRWKNNDPTLRKFTSTESKKLWSRPEHKDIISKKLKEYWSDEYRNKLISKAASERWKKESYRSKFSKDHFNKMANKLWQNKDIVKLHKEKALLQWQNDEFRKKFIVGVKKRNKKRIQEDPLVMRKLAEKAKIALKRKWKDPDYKKQVIQSKILKYVKTLTTRYSEVTPEIYENERRNNGVPKIKKALDYFNNFQNIVESAKYYNHKVVRVEVLTEQQDVYDLTIEGTHNFALAAGVFVHNSIDGDSPAAYRYTEARLTKLSEELLEDINKETVTFVDNYDATRQEPIVLPSKIPNLLINGSSGIAVGMATNIPPHNLKEVCAGVIQLIDDPSASVEQLIQKIPGPDFPTGALIYGSNGISDAYKTGRGKIKVRAKAHVEETKNKFRIIITEIPYMVNKASILENIASLIHDKKIQGISDLRDESDREGIRVVVELKSGANPDVILNQLYNYTRLQDTFSIILLALDNQQPKVLNIKELLQKFIDHRRLIVRKRTEYDCSQAEKKAHILEGLIIALNNIDDIISFIKSSKEVSQALQGLIQDYQLSEIQAKSILEMKLQRLTALEQEKIKTEHQELLDLIKELKSILASEERILSIIKDELIKIQETYGDERRTQIGPEEVTDLTEEKLIKPEEMVVTVSHANYVKRLPSDTYKKQRRGGKGVVGAETRTEDFIESLFVANTHDTVMFFTNQGRVHWLKVYQIPEAGRYAKGSAIINMISVRPDERVTAYVSVNRFDPANCLFMTTKLGTVKRISLEEFSKPRKGGITAITLDEGDELISVLLTDCRKQIMIATSNGAANRFKEEDIRLTGRTSKGVIGIKLKEHDYVVGAVATEENKDLLTITENGYGKRTPITEYRLINRGGSGVRNINITDKNSKVIGIQQVSENDELMIITQKGIAIRIAVKSISSIGRNTQGVRTIKLDEDDKVTGVALIHNEPDENTNSDQPRAGSSQL